jgi:2-polyprenyl-3-methyl-5-hydroxy-6-metoxy-1,4-benzoquinol methylase
MTAADRERWNAKYAERGGSADLKPPEWLVKHVADLPPGRALDLACGLGSTAIWLAERDWQVTAVDISPVGLEAARKAAEVRGVDVEWIATDLDDWTPALAAYDLVTVFRFLDRKTLPARIAASLRPGGRLLYETFVAPDFGAASSHVRNPAFVLQPGELPQLFSGLQVVEYEMTDVGGERIASLAARKL